MRLLTGILIASGLLIFVVDSAKAQSKSEARQTVVFAVRPTVEPVSAEVNRGAVSDIRKITFSSVDSPWIATSATRELLSSFRKTSIGSFPPSGRVVRFVVTVSD